MGANVQATKVQATNIVNIEKKPKHNPIYFLILFLPQKLNTFEYKPMDPCSEGYLFIG